jgi:riboflavin biosynthesis pyrimidine reductase
VSSIVLSADGKMAFSDHPAGPVIAKNNYLDPSGALADFWVLNAIRAYSDGIILGARTLQEEEHNTSHIFDSDLVEQRVDVLGRAPHPANIVVSFDATDIPLDHKIFRVDPSEGLPVAIATSPRGLEHLTDALQRPYVVLDDRDTPTAEDLNVLHLASDILPILVTGSADMPDSDRLMALLRSSGMGQILIESPSYTSHLINRGQLDEFFINYSMVYAGGSITPGTGFPQSHLKHPHAKLLTLATHSSSFMFTRQELHYDIARQDDLSRLEY